MELNMVEGLVSYLRNLCCGFFLSSSCVPYVASFSGLSIFYCPFGIL